VRHLSAAADAATLPPLTPRQADILGYVAVHQQEHGYAPVIREIGAAFGIRSPNAILGHLRALERKGYLKREPRKSRTLRPTGGCTLPYGGTVT